MLRSEFTHPLGRRLPWFEGSAVQGVPSSLPVTWGVTLALAFQNNLCIPLLLILKIVKCNTKILEKLFLLLLKLSQFQLMFLFSSLIVTKHTAVTCASYSSVSLIILLTAENLQWIACMHYQLGCY